MYNSSAPFLRTCKLLAKSWFSMDNGVQVGRKNLHRPTKGILRENISL